MAGSLKMLPYEGTQTVIDDVDLVLPAFVSGHLVSTFFAAVPPPAVVSARLVTGKWVALLVDSDGWLPLVPTGFTQDDVDFAEDGDLDEETSRFTAIDPQTGEPLAFDYAVDRRPKPKFRLSPFDRELLVELVGRIIVGG